MGILDDAIRQHLDLKRRLGAGDDELARLEDEAFGLPSRPGDPDFPETGSEPAQPDEGDVAAATPDAQAPDLLSEEPPTSAPGSIAAGEASVPTSGVDTVEHEISAEPDEDEPDLDLERGDDDVAGQEAEPEPSGSEPVESPDTVEHRFEGEVEDTGEGEVVEGELEEPAKRGEDPGGGEDEDVLEETPEFLRDQPEDDELWFEQGEPRDFDF